MKDLCLQVSTLAPNSVSEDIAEVNRKLERSQEDLNLMNQWFKQSQGKRPGLAFYKCYIEHKVCDVFGIEWRTNAELFE